MKDQTSVVDTQINESNTYNKLQNKWCLWAHLPHDTDWSLKSYKLIYKFNSIEEAVVLFETLPEQMVKNCMLFVMKEGIQPIWEDPKNRTGGCFSYKVANKSVVNTWKYLAYYLIGETLAVDVNKSQLINGITISPKKNFCIIKVWLSSCNYQNPNVINEVKDITAYGCLFKKHNPEY
jgi:hypothetical protein